jgi:hypothetical protein
METRIMSDEQPTPLSLRRPRVHREIAPPPPAPIELPGLRLWLEEPTTIDASPEEIDTIVQTAEEIARSGSGLKDELKPALRKAGVAAPRAAEIAAAVTETIDQ